MRACGRGESRRRQIIRSPPSAVPDPRFPSMSTEGSDPIASPAEARFVEALHTELQATGGVPVLLFSGGLDSSLLAYCLRELGRPPRLVTIGIAGATDLAAA